MKPPESVAAATTPQWATFIPGRNPTFKPHKTLGQAKNALTTYSRLTSTGFSHDMVLYQLSSDGQYLPYLWIAQGTPRDQYPLLAPKPKVRQPSEVERLQNSLRYHANEVERLRKQIQQIQPGGGR